MTEAFSRVFFAPMVPFVGHPWLALIVVGVLILLTGFVYFAQLRLAWPPLVASVCWLVYAVWEYAATQQGANIRVDLFVIAPVLYAVTLWGIVAPWIRLPRPAEA